LPEPLRDGDAVQWLKGEYLEQKQVQGALQEIGRFAHVIGNRGQ
jgi:hypothetical protein